MLALLFHTGRFFAAAAAVQHCNIALFTWGTPGTLFDWRGLSKASPEDPLSESAVVVKSVFLLMAGQWRCWLGVSLAAAYLGLSPVLLALERL